MSSSAPSVVCVLCALLSAGCKATPHGEVLVVVDTDLPVPRVAGRLRVDAYTSRGYWFASRDVARPDPRDWPASFSVYLPDEEETSLILRLRAYPDGRTRPYRGERFSDPVFVEPFVPQNPDEMCANAPRLELGKTVTIRRGRTPIIDKLYGGDCGGESLWLTTGSAAAYVDIGEPGRYRFAVVERHPDAPPNRAAQVSLQLRSNCLDPLSHLQCQNGIAGLPDFVVELSPGRYWLVVGGVMRFDGPADITLAAAREDAFAAVMSESEAEAESGVALLLRNDADATPSHEPEPLSTVDRLLRLELAHGDVGTAHVTLKGACAGTMAELGAGGIPAVDSAQTCIDTDGVRVPLGEEELEPGVTRPRLGDTLQGSFARDEPCEPEDAAVACVPSGVFLLGHDDLHMSGDGVPHTPERVARMPRFWIDRHEVTVARWRQAIEGGFDPALPFLHPHEELRDMPISNAEHPACTWTVSEGVFEDFALSCVNWYAARAFCHFVGGDLPTEAQWEYVATMVGRSVETAFPWGDEQPSCHCEPGVDGCHATFEGLFGNAGGPGANPVLVPGDCHDGSTRDIVAGIVPPPLAQGGAQGDTSAGIGVVGLAGGLSEWVRDSLHSYGEGCWANASIDNPECAEKEALARVIRGGSFLGALGTRMMQRTGTIPTIPLTMVGFRCAYATRPPQ